MWVQILLLYILAIILVLQLGCQIILISWADGAWYNDEFRVHIYSSDLIILSGFLERTFITTGECNGINKRNSSRQDRSS